MTDWWNRYVAAVGRTMLIVGAAVSRRTVIVWGADVFPALSVAVKVTVVTPSTVIGTAALAPGTSVDATGWAPLAL